MFIISYDLKSPQADYEAMSAAIQGQGAAQRILESTWVLDSAHNEDEIAAVLKAVIHEGDRFIVAEMREDRRQGWLAKSMWQWMREHDAPKRNSGGNDDGNA